MSRLWSLERVDSWSALLLERKFTPNARLDTQTGLFFASYLIRLKIALLVWLDRHVTKDAGSATSQYVYRGSSLDAAPIMLPA
jgi:hypothetical protein